MKTISILVPETAVPAAIVDPQYMFTAVNGFFQHAGHQPFFKVQLVGATKEIKLIGGSIIIKPDFLLTDTIHSDLIIIPAISGNVEEAIRQNEALVSWVIAQHKKGAEVASLCIGAFLLASTGLLNGKSCSTHWLFANDFRTLCPEVKLTSDRVVNDQDGLYSSGGAAS